MATALWHEYTCPLCGEKRVEQLDHVPVEPKRARKFVYPVYAVYPEARNEEAYEPILKSLRQLAVKHA